MRPSISFSPKSLQNISFLSAIALAVCANAQQWNNYGGDPQHSALSSVTSQSMLSIRWNTKVDEHPTYSGGTYLLAHYGSPTITAANTVIVPVKTGTSNGFRIDARDGTNGTLKWSATTDYTFGPHSWLPSYSPAVTPANRVYFPGIGGTVLYRDNADSPSGASGRIAFFGDAAYNANANSFNNNVTISTPITSDSAGNIYFGYRTTGLTTLGPSFTSGIARIAANGTTAYITAANATLNDTVTQIPTNCAPSLSPDGSKLYIATTNGSGAGDLVELDSATLAPIAAKKLLDPKSGLRASLNDNSTASPMIGPDGDVYYGVLENGSSNHSRGYLLHFKGDLSAQKTTGGFGWDDTPSVVPASMVPSYHGGSQYLILTKYNNYAGAGGDGVNKVAILDPNATQVDPIGSFTDMKEVLAIAGVTPDSDYVGAGFPNAVREWCINTAAVDLNTKSVLVNSEDGKLYRWDLTTNTFTQSIVLSGGIGEAYTPTTIGPDGSIYAMSNAMMSVVGVPEPTGIALSLMIASAMLSRRVRRE